MPHGIYRECRDVSQKVLLEPFLDTVLQQESILDVGCGSGWLATLLPPEIEYLGIDLHPDATKTALDRYGETPNHKYAMVDIFDYTPPHKFDMAIEVGMWGGLSADIKNITQMLINMYEWSTNMAVMVEQRDFAEIAIESIVDNNDEFDGCVHNIQLALEIVNEEDIVYLVIE